MSSLSYVVSGDVLLLLTKWAKGKGFALPNASFFDVWRKEFKEFLDKVFSNFIFIPEKDLVEKINTLSEQINLPKISLEGVYSNTNLFLSTNRTVDKEGNDLELANRYGFKSINDQIASLAQLDLRDVALIEDVIFSGESTSVIIRALSNVNIKVLSIITGIGITNGIKKIESLGAIVVRGFEFNEVIDEVCERDFFPGVPLSGRTFFNNNGKNIGMPYILPFGRPGEWASIPSEWQEPFSLFCLEQDIKLFEAIEAVSGREVLCSDLDRFVFSMPFDNINFVTQLKNIVIKMKES